MTTKLARTREVQSSRRGVRVERGKVEDGDGGEDVRVGKCQGGEGVRMVDVDWESVRVGRVEGWGNVRIPMGV